MVFRQAGPYLEAAWRVGVAAVIRYLLDPTLGPTILPLAPFYGAIALTAWRLGLGPGIFSVCPGFTVGRLLFMSSQGSLAVQFVSALLFAASSLVILASVESLHRAKRRIEAQELELRIANEQKVRFLATLSHELRNHLTSMRLAVDLIGLRSDAATSEMHDVLNRQIRLMNRLVDDLLDMAHVQTGTLSVHLLPCDLQTVLVDAQEVARSKIGTAGQHLEVNVPEGSVEVIGDAARLTQVVGNLLVKPISSRRTMAASISNCGRNLHGPTSKYPIRESDSPRSRSVPFLSCSRRASPEYTLDRLD
jgi:signal transduction histidine kinase